MGCLGFIWYGFLFLVLAFVVGSVEAAIGIVLAFFIATWVITALTKNRRRKKFTTLIEENIEVQMSQALADHVGTKAVALDGDRSFSFRVVGESYQKENFIELAKHLQVEEVETLMLQVQLVCQPNNPHDSKAVAVTLGGFLVGWVPKHESQRLHDFLLQHQGVATVNAKIFMDVQNQKFEIDLDLGYPLEIVRGIEPPGLLR